MTGNNDQGAILDCERREGIAVAAYAAALEKPKLPSEIRSLITTQARDVKDAHKEIHNLRSRFFSGKKT